MSAVATTTTGPSRETIAPEVGPLHATFEDAGVLGALHRLYARLRIDYAQMVDTTLGALPPWVQTGVFEDAVTQCDPAICAVAVTRAMALVRAQRRLRELIDAETAPGRAEGRAGEEEEEEEEEEETAEMMMMVDSLSESDLGPEPTQPMREPTMDPYRIAAIVRLCHGELLEAYAARRALQLCGVGEVVPSSAQHQQQHQQQQQQQQQQHQTEFAQLCNDAGLVAVWTSAHAEYLAAIDELMVGTPTGAPPPSVVDLLVPSPELHTVPCAANSLDLIALYERANSPKACPKSAQGLLAVLVRATNTGSRGWESTLEAILKESDGAVRVCMHAMGVALSGLHPCVHPAARRHWHVRFATIRRWRRCHPTNDFRDLVRKCPVAIKETMRLHLATLLAEDAATLEALAFSNLPAGQLSLPPRSVAPMCLQAAMHALMAAGADLVLVAARAPAAAAAAAITAPTVCEAINAHLSSEPRSRKKTGGGGGGGAAARPALKQRQQQRQFPTGATFGSSSHYGLYGGKKGGGGGGGGARVATAPLAYFSSWLGGRSGTSAAALCSATTVVSSLLAASFRADYVPFWLHSQRNGMRASRLDEAQYAALHRQSPAHAMCALLDERTALRVQRLAMTVSDASLLTVRQALALLGAAATAAAVAAAAPAAQQQQPQQQETEKEQPQQCVASAPGGSRAVQEAEQMVLALSGREAAMLVLFARCNALRSQILAYDLGPATRDAQARAVCKRLLMKPREGETHEQTALRRLPMHCTHIFACPECRRIVNARRDGSGKEVPFNEVGLSASMLHIDGDVCDGHMRCAKRSSAALRTAVALEDKANLAEVDTRDVDDAANGLLTDLRPASVMAALRGRPSGGDSDGGGGGGGDGGGGGGGEHAGERDEAGPSVDGRETASEVAKLRRDIKNCYEQHPKAIACGEVPLVRIPVLGRAVRLFDEWHALCSFCGCLARITPASRFRGDPCCMRCDFSMLYGKEAAKAAQALLPKPPAPSCRYCGKQQTEGASTRWKSVPAPADTGGRNAAVPPPLRVVYYCPTHWRSWLVNAHKELPTNIIFAHILQKARPMFGAERGSERGGSGGGGGGGGGGGRRVIPVDGDRGGLPQPCGANAPLTVATARRTKSVGKRCASGGGGGGGGSKSGSKSGSISSSSKSKSGRKSAIARRFSSSHHGESSSSSSSSGSGGVSGGKRQRKHAGSVAGGGSDSCGGGSGRKEPRRE